MDIKQLEQLGLSEKWPRLKKHLQEVDAFEKHRLQAESKVAQLRAGIPAAHERDLDAEAQAVRAGKGVPDAKHEPKLKAELDRATRESAVMARAVQGAREDLGNYLAKHQQQLYQGVAQARAEIGREAATAARTALAAYSRYEDLHYVLKDLQPPPEAPEIGPPQDINSVIGIATTRSTGPDRGTVEQMLQYVASLEDAA